MRGAGARLAAVTTWLFLGLVLVFLYAPLVPPAINSFQGDGPLFANYGAIFDDPRLLRAVRTSLVVGLLTAAITPLLALLAAEAVRVWRVPRLIIGILLIPLFVPGISMGVATNLPLVDMIGYLGAIPGSVRTT